VVGDGTPIAVLPLPIIGDLILSPTSDLTIQGVVTDVGLPVREPSPVWRFLGRLEDRAVLFIPEEVISHLVPETLRIVQALLTNLRKDPYVGMDLLRGGKDFRRLTLLLREN